MAALRALMALSLGILAAGKSDTAKVPADLVIDFTSDLKGSIEKCGCHVGQFGGVARRASYLHSVEGKDAHKLLLSGGDLFPPGGTEELQKGVTIIKSLKAMNYDAVTLGDFDFSHGLDALAQNIQGLPLVTTNMVWSDTKEPIGEPMLLKTYRGVPSLRADKKEFKVAILSFMDERMQLTVNYYLEKEKRHVTILPAAEAAREWIPKARERANLVVALVHMNTTDAQAFAKANPGLDVVVSGHVNEVEIDPPLKAGNTWVVANGDRGRFVGELFLNFGPDMQLLDATGRMKPLDDAMGEDSTVAAIVAAFKLGLAQQRGETSLRGDAGSIAPLYATSQVCANCHREIALAWAKTQHAHAYETLLNTHDQAREECVQCHTLGYGTPGGFDVNSPQPVLMGVQCESCHGGGTAHAMAKPEDKKAAIVGKPSAAVCMKCHNSERDPAFEFAMRWAKIRH